MPYDFPNAPTNGQTVTGASGSYRWDGSKWTATPAASSVVSSFNTRTGSVVLSSGDVTTALTYTPYNATNPSGYQTAAQVTTALAPYAPLASPVLTGNPTAPTPTPGDNDTSLATTAFVQAAQAPSVGKNLLHNGLFTVAQRGTGPWTTNGYTLDRWAAAANVSSINLSRFAFAVAGLPSDEEAKYVLTNAFTGTAGAIDCAFIYQPIEGVTRLANKTVTVSFWAAAAAGTPKLGVSLDQNFGTGGSPSAQVNGTGQAVTLSTTYTRYSLTFSLPSISGKTLGSNGNDYTELNFWYSSGANNNTRAGSIGVQSGTVSLWGVQCEVGSVATQLEKPDPEYQLRQCQRMYQVGGLFGQVNLSAASSLYGIATMLPVAMRAAPTVAISANGNSNLSGFTLGAMGAAGIKGGGSTITAGATTTIDLAWTASADL